MIKNIARWSFLFLLFFLILASWLGWFFVPRYYQEFFPNEISNASALGSAIGESFGPLNALFAALGFAAVLLTLYVQGNALRAQQRDQYLQRFDVTFFELLRLLRESKIDVQFSHSPSYRNEKSPKRLNLVGVRSGQSAYSAAMRECRHWMKSPDISKEEISGLYLKYVHSRYESRLGPYFRLLYTILDRINNDKFLGEDEKKFYGNLLRSQLSSHEVGLAGINGLAPVAKDLSKLITKFRILKYLPEGHMRRLLEKNYAEEAFEERD